MAEASKMTRHARTRRRRDYPEPSVRLRILPSSGPQVLVYVMKSPGICGEEHWYM
jgi:hypothetical protein